jgi:phosphoribosylformylglycinamidine cyclo-ligase
VGTTAPDDTPGLTYRDAGVDIEEGDRLVENIKAAARATHGPEVLGGLGGFASLFSIKRLVTEGAGMEDPLLVAGTDGVGTKLKVAFATGRHGTVGEDLVAMCVNDVLTTGARPLFFLDYFGTGKLSADAAAEVVLGVAEGCRKAGCALVGGETAELPGLYAPGEYDLAGFCVGIVDRPHLVDGATVRPGDVVLGVLSRGVHSNGLSLAQKALLERGGLALDARLEGCALDVGGELLRPTAIYRDLVDALMQDRLPKAMAHITGGGIPGNLPRVLPEGTVARLDRGAWPKPALFGHIQRLGGVAEPEMYRTFNMGVGLAVVVAADAAEEALRRIQGAGEVGQVIGEIVPGEGEARVLWTDGGEVLA